jgi:AraC-like DNA-binding protein
VRETIATLVPRGYPTIHRAARALGCSPRTLQRRLQQAGISYGELVDRVRMDAALRLLEDSTLRQYEIASALGFADPSSFSRFFLRISGTAPRRYRRERIRRAKFTPRH